MKEKLPDAIISNDEMTDWLKKAGVTPTPVRILVFKTIINSQTPLSLSEIELLLDSVDKSSISRALNLFKTKHLVHCFDDMTGSMKYEVCISPRHIHHDDSHIHFHCKACGQTYCFHSLKVPEVNLPEGFKIEDSNFLLSGICSCCSNKTENKMSSI